MEQEADIKRDLQIDGEAMVCLSFTKSIQSQLVDASFQLLSNNLSKF